MNNRASLPRFLALPLVIILLLSGTAGAAATEWWPFREVNRERINVSANAGYHFDSNVAVMGFGATIYGVHITIGGVGTCRLPEGAEPSGKTTASAMVQFGYQLPVTRSFRVIPVVGTAAVGKIVYDMDDAHLRGDDDPPKTRLKMSYRFDAGVHFVFNYKKLIVNAAITRYTVFGGIGVEF